MSRNIRMRLERLERGAPTGDIPVWCDFPEEVPATIEELIAGGEISPGLPFRRNVVGRLVARRHIRRSFRRSGEQGRSGVGEAHIGAGHSENSRNVGGGGGGGGSGM
jgi:hypothetical protein